MDKLFYDVFEALPRQGPGDDVSTGKAFRMLTDLPSSPDILDIGCGSGTQTLALAKLTDGRITAVDNHQAFLEMFKRRYAAGRFRAKVSIEIGDMASLPYPDESFDLIWAEGSSFIIGIENALRSWRRLLRPKGFLALSDLVWFRCDVPVEIRDFFTKVSPGLLCYEDVLQLIASEGYETVGHFRLPQKSWWTEFYAPMEKTIEEKKKEHTDAGARELFDSLRLQMRMHEKYHEFYGYGFYVMRKRMP